jgi:hypothetical protein
MSTMLALKPLAGAKKPIRKNHLGCRAVVEKQQARVA